MATKKKEEEAVVVNEVTEEIDPFTIMKEIRLPRGPQGEPDTVYAAVNGRAWYVKRGVVDKVPLPIYEVLMNALDAEEASDRFAREREQETEIAKM